MQFKRWRPILRQASTLFSRHGGGERTLVIYIEEHLEVVKRRSLIVSLVMVLGVLPVCHAAAVCISSVLPTRGTLQYVRINTICHCNVRLTNGRICLKRTFWFFNGYTNINKKSYCCKKVDCDYFATHIDSLLHHICHLWSCCSIFVFCLVWLNNPESWCNGSFHFCKAILKAWCYLNYYIPLFCLDYFFKYLLHLILLYICKYL